MKRRGDSLDDALSAGHTVLADTSVVLAYLSGEEAISRLATQLFDAFSATGRNPTSLSVVTAAELLVRPFRRGSAAVTTVEGFLRHFGELQILDVTYGVAHEAARIRADSGLPMPEALIAASAVVEEVDVLVTNDRTWPSRLAPVLPELSVLVLADMV